MTAYLAIDTDAVLEDITRRKEFYQYRVRELRPHHFADHYQPQAVLTPADLGLQLSTYQHTPSLVIHPSTPYTRLLLKQSTGVGKTISSIVMALPFIDMYEREQQDTGADVPSVFVIGFTEEIFKRELLRFPEFGYVSTAELAQIDMLRRSASTGRADADRLHDYQLQLRKRLVARTHRGYWRFFGYKAFVNRIFAFDRFDGDFSAMSDADIRRAVRDGRLQFNTALLASFRRSVIICDEIHNVYNSQEVNNWGLALQLVLEREPTVRAVFMSATPLNNSPSEIVDLANLMDTPRVYTRDTFFDDRTLRPGALAQIARIFNGRVSFIQDQDPRYYAAQHIEGTTIPGVDYLRFVRCRMSAFHQRTYDAVYTGALTQDAQYLLDIAFPDPNSATGPGLYRTNDVRRALGAPTDEWYKKYGVRYSEGTITGWALELPYIARWSAKYAQLVTDVLATLSPHGGKSMIYHDVVHMSGVLFIEQLLQANGFVGMQQGDTAHTRCAVCGILRAKHPQRAGGSASAATDAPRAANGPAELAALTALLAAGMHVLTAPVVACRSVGVWHADRCVAAAAWQWEDDTVLAVATASTGEPDTRRELRGRVLAAVPVAEAVCVSATTAADSQWYHSQGFVTHDRDAHAEYMSRTAPADSVAPADSTASGGAAVLHEFVPARYIIAHSDVDRVALQRNIERFNAVDNTWGYTCRIVLGSKIIKESLTFLAVRHVMIASRPTNIATLIQILGRARRKHAHEALPAAARTIAVRIYTSACASGLSHEELRYQEKVADYKLIQRIERTMHEHAVDGVTAREIVRPGISHTHPALGALWFRAAQPERRYRTEDLSTTTFEAFHAADEVAAVTHLIKRLFVEQSTCYQFDQLWRAVLEPPFAVERDTSLTGRDAFVIALTMLTNMRLELVGRTPTLAESLRAGADTRITQPCGTVGRIHQFERWYVWMPDACAQTAGAESAFRAGHVPERAAIDVLRYVHEHETRASYESQRLRYKRQAAVPLAQMAAVVGRFPVAFHRAFMEESIEYVFRMWTLPATTLRSELHDVYFRTLYYFDISGVVVWAATLREFMREIYLPYTMPLAASAARTVATVAPASAASSATARAPSEAAQRRAAAAALAVVPESAAARTPRATNSDPVDGTNVAQAVTPSTQSAVRRAVSLGAPGSPQASEQALDLALSRSAEHVGTRRAVNAGIVRADPKVLPVGHFLANVPRFYHPERGWFDSPEYTQAAVDYVENEKIIGYYERATTSLRMRFKIRLPLHKITRHADVRMNEKGSICATHPKMRLVEIAQELGIAVAAAANVPDLCAAIEAKLQANEVSERERGTSVKWFYNFWEHRPDDRVV